MDHVVSNMEDFLAQKQTCICKFTPRATINSEIFVRTSISRIVLKDIFSTFIIRAFGMIYLHQ